MGMRLADFASCTPLEFSSIAEAWRKQEENKMRTSWEQTRIAALYSVQPHVSKALKAKDVMRLPWDDEEGKKSARRTRKTRKKKDSDAGLTADEIKEKYQKMWVKC